MPDFPGVGKWRVQGHVSSSVSFPGTRACWVMSILTDIDIVDFWET